MDYVTSYLKKCQDRQIPLAHPYITVYKGESHHIQRYEHNPDIALVLVEDQNYTEEDAEINKVVYEHFALNLRQEFKFFVSIDGIGGLVNEINSL